MVSKGDEQHQDRRPIHNDLSKYLTIPAEKTTVKCIGVDASNKVLRIVSFHDLALESEVVFTGKQSTISLTVTLSKPDEQKENIFHICLQTRKEADNLIEALKAEGVFDEPTDSPKSETDKEKNDGVKQDPVEVNFQAIKDQFSNLHLADQTQLRKIGLVKLRDTHKAYPIIYKGVSLIILLPNDLKPKKAAALEEKQAAEKLIILKYEGENWVKAWP